MSEFILPRVSRVQSGGLRRVGFELEFSGVDIDECVRLVQEETGGIIEEINAWNFVIRETKWGDFSLALDLRFVINSELRGWMHETGLDEAIDAEAFDAIEYAIGSFTASLIPYELTTPPLPLDAIARIETLKERLRTTGALGTKANPFYVFGFHINPEIPCIDVQTILSYLRAFLLLYDYLVDRVRPDLSRRLSPYIDPFPADYVKTVLHPAYCPKMPQLIDDYLDANPTRNRALDLLPLLAWIDTARVRAALPEAKIRPRPAFHYRLPNSYVDDPAWHTYDDWNNWVLVEKLANDLQTLVSLAYERYKMMNTPFYRLEKKNWIERMRRWAENAV